MNYDELIRQKLAAMEAIFDKAKAENRGLNETEQALYDDLEKEAKALEASAKREKEMLDRKEALRASVTPPPGSVKVGDDLGRRKPWNSFGEFLNAVKRAYDPSRGFIDNRLMGDRETGSLQNSTGTNVSVSSDGGFMVTQQFVTKMMGSIATMSSVFSRIFMIPIGEGSNGIVMPAMNETSRADGSRSGGVRAYWANEGGTATSSKPKIREITLKLEKLLAFCYMTEELMRDASAMEAFVNQKYSEEMSFKLDDAIFNGDGLGKPLGVLNSPALITVTKETGQTADTVVWENIIKMWSRLAPTSQTRATWFINQEVQKELMTMSQVVGTGGVPVFLPAGGASGLPYMTLMGRPVIPVEQLSKLGDAGDILLADMSDYVGIDKGGLETDTSIHVQFLYDENVFRFRYRFNGTPYTNSPVTSYKNTSHTVSPYVTLGAR
jgi:HK97 family phage major capsid protein